MGAGSADRPAVPPPESRLADPDRVVLSEAARAERRGLVGAGVAPARRLTRARRRRPANHGEDGPGWADAVIVAVHAVHASPVRRGRRQFAHAGLAATLERQRPDRGYERALDGAHAAKLARPNGARSRSASSTRTVMGADVGFVRCRRPPAATTHGPA